MMNTIKFSQKQYGFSMIEVMISIVVLGFGLLALAALQTSVIRSSSETKAQTIALQLAKDKIEDLRAFQELSGYQALDSGNDTPGTVSGVAFTRSWVIARFAYNSAGSVIPVAPNVGVITTAGTYVADNEYKTMAVTVNWTDANGATQSLRLDDAIGALAPGDGSKVVLNNTSSTQQRNPRILIFDPSSTPGVIPIAVGNGTDTAATNPKPEVSGNNNNKRVVETRFDILTYAGLNNGTARAQSRVETAVIGCTCNKGNAVSTDTAYRPSYWNGFRYTVPQVAGYAPLAGEATIPNNAPPQSQYCTSCCRDHHDPVGTTTAKFDPRRLTAHTHYKIVSGALVAAGANDDYLESCRLIRVDGIFRVAADLNNDYFNLLETKNDNTSLAYSPTATATLNYQNIVLDYLGQRIVNQGTSTLYNTLLSDSAVTTLETTRSINSPPTISINRSNDSKWLHSRGLFIDYLEPEAIDRITEAKTKCSVNSTLQTCVLPFVPFTSINLSELSNWTPLAGEQLKVTNNDFSGSTGGSPVRGKVEPGTNPTNNTNQLAYSAIYSSNSGVAVLGYAIDADEVQLQDQQVFAIGGGSPPLGAGLFSVNLTGYTFGLGSSNPTVKTTYSTSDCNPTVLSINPYLCSVTQIGVSASITLGKYNYEGTKVAFAPTAPTGITCTNQQGQTITTITNVRMTIPANSANARRVCKNFTVASSSVGTVGAVTSEGKGAETTVIEGTFLDASTINIGLSAGTDTLSPVSTMTCKSEGANSSDGAIIADNKLTLTWADPCL